MFITEANFMLALFFRHKKEVVTFDADKEHCHIPTIYSPTDTTHKTDEPVT